MSALALVAIVMVAMVAGAIAWMWINMILDERELRRKMREDQLVRAITDRVERRVWERIQREIPAYMRRDK